MNRPMPAPTCEACRKLASQTAPVRGSVPEQPPPNPALALRDWLDRNAHDITLWRGRWGDFAQLIADVWRWKR
jgi:hypothetical protein